MANFAIALLSGVGLVFFLSSTSFAGTTPKVKSIDYLWGSVSGGLVMSIYGEGFSQDQYGSDTDPNKGNKVTLVSLDGLYTRECAIQTTMVSSTKLSCETSPAPHETNYDFEVVMHVDGVRVKNPCGSKCVFRYRYPFTPTVKDVQPRTGVTGTVTQIYGKIFTSQLSRIANQTNKEFNPNAMEIIRIRSGNKICDPFDAVAGTEFESSLGKDGIGFFTCKPASKIPESNIPYFIVSKRGRSKPENRLMQVDADQDLYIQQTHADVKSVSPSSGSLEGGTVMTIFGEGFGNRVKLDDNQVVAVDIDGVPCKVSSVSPSQIKCTTGRSNNTRPAYPGGRGLLLEVWQGTIVTNLSDIETMTSSAHGYVSEILTNGSVPEVTSFNRTLGYSAKVSGFFQAPWDDAYIFNIKSDNKSVLYISTDGDPANMTMVASVSGYARAWTTFTTQRSSPVNLKKGQQVYLAAYYVNMGLGKISDLSIGIRMGNVRHVSSTLYGANDEWQRLSSGCHYKWEKQVLDFNSWTGGSFKLRYGGRSSSSIFSSVTKSALTDTLNDLFSVICNRPTCGSGCLWQQSYETFLGGEGADITGQDIPYCGRRSLKKRDKYGDIMVYNSGHTRTSGGRVDVFDPAKYKWFCFAYKGNVRAVIQIFVWFQVKSGRRIARTAYLPFNRGPVTEEWRYTCINLLNAMESDSTFGERSSNPNYQLQWIRFLTEKGGPPDFSLDELWIGKYSETVTQTTQPALPAGHFIQSITVEELSTKRFAVKMHPAKCGENVPLFGIENGIVQQSGDPNTVYNYLSGSPSSNVTVERLVAASPPIRGTFNLTCGLKSDKIITDISSDVTSATLKELIEENCDQGEVAVNTWGSCAGRGWDIRYRTVGGNHPQMKVDANFTGHSPWIRSETKSQGSYFMAPVTSEFLRLPCSKPQVRVMAYGIPSSSKCQNSSFEYSSSKTPTSSSVSPVTMTPGSQVNIGGTGFSTNCSENTILIGSIVCALSACTESSLTCTLDSGEGGIMSVNIHVFQKGNAHHQLPNITVTTTVTTITPDRGSTAGGLVLNITGDAFSEIESRMSISLDNSSCDIIETSVKQVICRTTAHAAGQVAMSVTVNGALVTKPSAFNYNSSLTPTVTSITPLAGGVSGSGLLNISGSGFGTVDAVVTIGTNACPVTSQTDTEINCIIPASGAAGTFAITVHIPNKGYPVIPSSYKNYTYDFTIISISPLIGSLAGGTMVTITGSGFSLNVTDNVIKIGGKPCTVTNANATSVTCKTADNFRTWMIDNSGRHGAYSLGYAWSKKNIAIRQGDTVKWSWATAFLSDTQYQVFQTKDQFAITYDGEGFRSSRSSAGSFSRQFINRGLVYYSSGFVDANQLVYMNGKVEVGEFSEDDQAISFTIRGATPSCSATQEAAQSSTSCDSGVTSEISGCTAGTVTQSTPSTGDCLKFQYRKCHTPIVTRVLPVKRTSLDTITITGTGFSVTQCQNSVTFGGHVCNVFNSSDTQISCRLNTSTKPPAGTRLNIALNVLNRGNAIIEPQVNATTHFTLLPRVVSLAPSSGSLRGGTRVTLTGEGFENVPTSNNVKFGIVKCDVVSSNYTEIVCLTPTMAEGEVDVTVAAGDAISKCLDNSCRFNYSQANTPEVDTIQGVNMTSPNHTLTVTGTGFGAETADNKVTVGNTPCTVTASSSTSITCVISGLPIGDHAIKVRVQGKGDAFLKESAAKMVTSMGGITSVTPAECSTNGGVSVTITGNGFQDGVTSVTVGGVPVTPTSVIVSEMVITTVPLPCSSASCLKPIIVTVGGITFSNNTIAYSTSATPVVNSISSASLSSGQTLTINGTFPAGSSSTAIVRLGNYGCPVTQATESNIQCTVPTIPAGVYPLGVTITGKGKANSTLNVTIELVLSLVTPSESGYGGGRTMVVTGKGFCSATVIKICGNTCSPLTNVAITDTQISCDVPPHARKQPPGDTICDVEAISGSQNRTLSNTYTYKESMTSEITAVSPARGGTGGGVTLTISGSGFNSTQSENNITIDGTPCLLIFASATTLRCIAGQHRRTIKTQVIVEVGSNGRAILTSADFYYVDVWSSKFSWGYKNPPGKGALAIIKKGQTMLIDTDTAILKMLLIQGGTVLFDDTKDIHLQAEYILIVENGTLQVGTVDDPFTHQATITLHGHQLCTELPVYGCKVIAVREGTLDLHGKHVNYTWTRLNQTAYKGDTRLHLQLPVTWKAGDQVVIAATGQNQEENEKLTITDVLNGGFTIQVEPPLKYKHISIEQIFDGRPVETRAEVGLLTRNVKVIGSVQADWNAKIPKCDREFKPGQFKTQSCFQGKFGAEIETDGMGATIMLHGPSPGSVAGRFSYVELRNVGQEFRLGRYPIHFHMMGSMRGSYVRGCAIYHSHHRAVTIHGTNEVVVEHNVVYDIKGNAVFMEEGAEILNVVKYNLGIFVTSSSSALNVDITPATFWVTNANNIVSDNAAAGGSHFGFWYQMFEHPEGPSYDKNICPRKVPLLEFRNNSAHSFGRYGLWIFPKYYPMRGGSCFSSKVEPAHFTEFLAWNNMRGAEAVNVGAVRFINFTILDSEEAGIEYVSAAERDNNWGGALISNSLIVSKSAAGTSRCTRAGIRTPNSHYLVVSNVTFASFNNDEGNCRCAAIRTCSQCKHFKKKGGFGTKFRGLKFEDSTCRAAFEWKFEHILYDEDGTLTDLPGGGAAVPTNGLLPPSKCAVKLEFSRGVPTSVCDNTVKFRRFFVNAMSPESLYSKDINFTNQYGSDVVHYAPDHKMYEVTLVMNEDYKMAFVGGDHITNISYFGRLHDPGDCEWARISHRLYQKPDHIETVEGEFQNMTNTTPAVNSSHGSWSFNKDTKLFKYILSGCNKQVTLNGRTKDREVKPRIYRCFHEGCLKPTVAPIPDSRPENFKRWWTQSDWPDNQIPQSGSDVTVPENTWMVIERSPNPMNKLYVYGVLEVNSSKDILINASYILVTGGFIIGSPDKEYKGNATINLRGDHSSEDTPMQGGPNTGTKSLSVFGYMHLHGRKRSVYWTKLANSTAAGTNTITLKDPVDWLPGEQIVVTSTTKEPRQSELAIIESVSEDNMTLTLIDSLTYNHKSMTDTADGRTYTLAAEVGLLTRNIKLIGAEDATGSVSRQAFGMRLLVSSFSERTGRATIENVEFENCGQEGWTDDYDLRSCIWFKNIGNALNSSYVKGCALHNTLNIGIGVHETNKLTLENNVIHRPIGPGIQLTGKMNRVIRNLVADSRSTQTFMGRVEMFAYHWHGAIETVSSESTTLIGNSIAGSERLGYRTDGEPCDSEPSPWVEAWRDNEVHGAWHGIHVGYFDGYKPCSKLSGFTTWGNIDYGIFFYSDCSFIVENSIVADNDNGLLPNLYGPDALKHLYEDRFFIMRNTLLIGTSPGYNCSEDNIVPEGRKPYDNSFGAKKPKGGKAGVATTFCGIVKGGGPVKGWESIHSYTNLHCRTNYINVTFAYFGASCGKRDYGILMSPWVGDIFHPTTSQGIIFHQVDTASKILLTIPKTIWINPADCVDMDCDARRQFLLIDKDGSLTGLASTVISKAEYAWDGDRRFGLGDYRIPKTALTRPDGSRINSATAFPHKGIIRGNGAQTSCSWKKDWFAYHCTNLEHCMLVIESMDADTETRRLSPVAIISETEGYVNLVNGPMDHGWCLGYTCQERISTFYAVVAAGKEYKIYFSSYAPQHLRLHLLCGEATHNKAVKLGVYFRKPQRKDVYNKDMYIAPTNAQIQDGSYTSQPIPVGQPNDYWHPRISDTVNGQNWFDNSAKTMYLLLRGVVPIDIRTAPVVKLSLTVKATTVDDFFKTNLVNNLAALLGIDQSMISVMEVVSAIRKRRATETTIVIQIANPPQASLSLGAANGTNTTSSSNSTGSSNATSFAGLEALASKTVEVVQSGDLASKAGVEVTGLAVEPPVPPPVDPTGGVRATNETSGSGNVTNGTLTYAQQQAQAEADSQPSAISYSIPCQLVIFEKPQRENETVVFAMQPRVQIRDCSGNPVVNLGLSANWTLTAKIRNGTGDANAQLNGTVFVPFVNGWANYTDLSVTHSAPGYVLDFNVSYPLTAKFAVSSNPFPVVERMLHLVVVVQPSHANKTYPFHRQPVVEVRDAATGELVTNTGWRGREWLLTAAIANPQTHAGTLNGTTAVQVVSGVARFNNLSIDTSGTGYQLNLTLATNPVSGYHANGLTSEFDVTDIAMYLYTVVDILELEYQAVNETVKGTRGELAHKARVKLNMSDGSVLSLIDVTPYSGLFNFSSSDTNVVSIHPASGKLTLNADHNTKVTVTVTTSGNSSITASFSFFANPDPAVGEIDIGESLGPAMKSLSSDQQWSMPITVNPGTNGLLAMELKLNFDASQIAILHVASHLQYDVTGNTITIFGAVEASNSLLTTVGSVTMRALTTGIPVISIHSYRTVDKAFIIKPPTNPVSCTAVVKGDINRDCAFDIIDVAFIKGHLMYTKTGALAGIVGQATESQKQAMDVDWNTRIEGRDAWFMAEIYLNRAKFFTEFTVKLPDNSLPSTDSTKCNLEIKTKFVNKDGSSVQNNLDVFYDISISSAALQTQVEETEFSEGTKVVIKDRSNLYGVIVKSESTFVIGSLNSKLKGDNIGMSVIQVVTVGSDKHVVPMFSGDSSGAGVLVTLVDGVQLTLPSGYSPQRMINIAQTTSNCKDPEETHTLELVFEGNYQEIVDDETAFKKSCEDALHNAHRGCGCQFTVTQVRAGSIILTTNLTVAASLKESTLAMIYENVKNGITVTHNGHTITSKDHMTVNGKQYQPPNMKLKEEGAGLSSGTIIAIAVSSACVFALVMAIGLYCACKKKKVTPSPPSSPDHQEARDNKIWSPSFGDWNKERRATCCEVDNNNILEQSVRSAASIERKKSDGNPVAEMVENPIPEVKEEDDDTKSIESMEAGESKSSIPANMTPRLTRAFTKKPLLMTDSPLNTPPLARVEDEVKTKGSTNLNQASAFNLLCDSSDPTPSVNRINSRPQTPVQAALPNTLEDEESENQGGARQPSPAPSFASLVVRALEEDNSHIHSPQGSPAQRRTTHKQLPISVLRPNAKLGLLTHNVGSVSANILGTLQDLRRDMQTVMSRNPGMRYLFVSKRLTTVDPQQESSMLVEDVFVTSVRIKLLQASDHVKDICPCGLLGEVWCEKCKGQMYCSEACREQDEINHAKRCLSGDILDNDE